MWQIEQALVIVRALQPSTRDFGYHLALGGGVLNKGRSDKDVDLYFLPMGGFSGNQQHDPSGMLKFLEAMWGGSEPLASRGGGTVNELSFYKHAVQFTRWGGDSRNIPQRIDCFIF